MDPQPKIDHRGPTLREEIRLAAPPAEVYRAWADPERIAGWFVDRAEGEALPGGEVTWHFDAFDPDGSGLPMPVIAAEPGRRLVFGGELPGRPAFLQEIELEPAEGGTLLRLTHSGFPEQRDLATRELLIGVESGWRLALATLSHWLDGHRGEPRTHLFVGRPADCDPRDLFPFYMTARGLELWFAEGVESGESELRTGGEYRMRLHDGEVMGGRVLARSRREILLSWEQARALLAFKVYGDGPGRRAVALDFNAWGLDPARAAAIEVSLEASIDGLVEQIPRPRLR